MVIKYFACILCQKIVTWRSYLNYPINFYEFLNICAFLQHVIARIWYVQNIRATIPAIICKNLHEHFHLDVDLRTMETRNNTAASMQIHCVPSLRQDFLCSCQFLAMIGFFSLNPTTKTWNMWIWNYNFDEKLYSPCYYEKLK